MSERRFTDEVLSDEMAAILRAKPQTERLRIAGRMWRSARVLIRAAIRTKHPDWSEERVNREIARRISHGAVSNELL